ncbi:conserved Plasmodium protein, unknown function [Plasmodium vinckei]|uniref:Ubiquitin-like domain-containing protein n=4 Tax=Plasmodium (Vinckeia) TaxID=418101 RepID=W7B7I7_PLAVN|nr:hypothetical protein YYG_01086 [Plasmodium vinckei petteri]CAD2093070.1 conserved Plasmodium protein, unknown function [Plasmodium vinckei lentum]CAD2106020.1 conserved Plasmodium protein, unknown function [Plasmodium vinckei petteri]CAD2106142.1 conserved Plasmodium protein, unknown function [Plasmodium vinckei]SCN59372.1 conserved Plasmodium protein, unknown function [Plasmodium chabaudi adami]
MAHFFKGSISLPMEEDKEKKNIENEEQIKILFHLPNGDIETVYENLSIEVGYLKLKLSKSLQRPYDKFNLLYNNNIMIDPLSIIDIIKAKRESIDIYVNFIE